MPQPHLTSTAVVATSAAERYAKQLLSHLGQRVAFETEDAVSTAVVAGASVRIVVGDRDLTLTVSGDQVEAVAQARHVLGSHLERFGRRDGLTVQWSDAGHEMPENVQGHERPDHRRVH